MDFSDIYLIRFFGIRNIGKTSAMRVNFFFWKCSEFNVDFENAKKNSEKTFWFWYHCIWIVCVKLSPLRREYMSAAVNVWKKFCISLKETLSNSFTSKSSLSFRLHQCLRFFNILAKERSSKKGHFRHISNHAFSHP